MYLTIIILPLLGSVVSGFFGRKIGISGARILTCLAIIITTLLAIMAFIEIGINNNPTTIYIFKWLNSEFFNMIWHFQFDSLTVSMLIPVLIISSLVHIYSIGYMSNDPHNQRFFSYLSLFTFMMIILVTGNNYLLMFVGWEGVGVCSYLLVSFWFTRIAANQSSMSAFLTNRVGDCLLTIGMFCVLWSLGNLDYATTFSLTPYINENSLTIIGICLLIGAMAKSSQVGLHVWLPMAMEGPTPVSALIHAATMVTAGVYLLIRSSPLLEYSSTLLLICLWLGAVTTLFSSLIGLFQQDIKKIIAYSTMSQLGMMVISIGLSFYNLALFHLINHAFYKGLLFLGAGAVIHAMADNQDLRKYGGLIKFLPLSYSVILIASLSLVAFPFMTGFFSKDFILESAFGQYHFSSISVYFIAVIGAIFTTLYSSKVLYLTFLSNPNGPINYYKHSHESDIFISLPLIILAVFSIYFGFITKDLFIGLGSGFFKDNSIFIHPNNEILLNTEFSVPVIFKLLPFIFTILFSTIALVYMEYLANFLNSFKLSYLGKNIFGFFNQRFLIEYFYNEFITNFVLKLGGQTTKILDKGSIELGGPLGIEKILIKSSKIFSKLSTSIVTDYALYLLLGFNLYLFSYFWTPNLEVILYLIICSCIACMLFYILLTYNYKPTTLQSSFISYEFFSDLIKKISWKVTMKMIIAFVIYLFTNTVMYLDGDSDSEGDNIPKLDKGKGKDVSLEEKNIPNKTENTTSEENNSPKLDKGKGKEVSTDYYGETLEVDSDPEASEKDGEHYFSKEEVDYMNYRARQIHEWDLYKKAREKKMLDLMIKHSQKEVINKELELKKDDLYKKQDKELTNEEIQEKNVLHKEMDRAVDLLSKDLSRRVKLDETIDTSGSSSNENKRSSETKKDDEHSKKRRGD